MYKPCPSLALQFLLIFVLAVGCYDSRSPREQGSDGAANPAGDEGVVDDDETADETATDGFEDLDGDGWSEPEDCDDQDAEVHPAANEVCNELDDDDDSSDDDNSSDDDDDGSSTVAPPMSASGSCTGQIWTWAANPVIAPELNVIGMYESDGGHGAPAGTTIVEVNRAGPMVLVLSSYEPVDWVLNLGPGANITQVILNGYHPSTVSGLASGTTVEHRTGPGNYLSACAYDWPGTSGTGCSTPTLVSQLQSLTGLQLNSLQGCYHGTSWTLN